MNEGKGINSQMSATRRERGRKRKTKLQLGVLGQGVSNGDRRIKGQRKKGEGESSSTGLRQTKKNTETDRRTNDYHHDAQPFHSLSLVLSLFGCPHELMQKVSLFIFLLL